MSCVKIRSMLRNRAVRMCRVIYIHFGPTRIVNTPLLHQNSEFTIVYNLSLVRFRKSVNITGAEKLLVPLQTKVLAPFYVTPCVFLQSIHKPTNAPNKTQFMNSYKTPTCSGTGVPSPGSLLEKRNTSPRR